MQESTSQKSTEIPPERQQEEEQQCSLEKQQEGLPEELYKNKTYHHKSELWVDLERFELTDLHIVLNTEGFAVWREMPSSEHARAVDVIEAKFHAWKQDRIVKSAMNPMSLWIKAKRHLPK
jgi:hypothetical protein